MNARIYLAPGITSQDSMASGGGSTPASGASIRSK
jgi:hypothetical protein